MSYPSVAANSIGWGNAAGALRKQDAADQIDAIRSIFGKNVRKLIALPNLEPGYGYGKPSGYVLALDPNTPMEKGVFDVYSFYRGRVLMPLVEGLSEEQMISFEEKITKFPSAKFLAIFAKARRDAFAFNEAAAEATAGSLQPVPYLRPSIGSGIEASCSIINKVFRNENMHIVVDDHCSLSNLSDKNSHGSPVVEELLQSVLEMKGSVSAFFNSNMMIRYFDAQRRYRSLVSRLVRKALLYEIFGEAEAIRLNLMSERDLNMGPAYFTGDAPVPLGEIHQTTNTTMDDSRTESIVFYSNALSALEPAGAFIYGGPLGGALWVNRRGSIIMGLMRVNKHGAVPYEMPATRSRVEALEIIAEMMSSPNKALASSMIHELSPTTEAPDVAHVMSRVSWVNENDQLETLRGGLACVTMMKRQAGVLVIVPDLLKGYRAGIDSATTRAILDTEFGVVRDTQASEVFLPIKTAIDNTNTLVMHQLWLIHNAMRDRQAASVVTSIAGDNS